MGLVAGAQFAAALLSRFWAGQQADSRGARRATIAGLLLAAAAGLLYLLSLRLTASPEASVAILIIGRGVLGGAESFIVMGALGWGLARAGPQNTGAVMSWVGRAMYIAYAAGAPAGTALYASHGFVAIALATTLIPRLAGERRGTWRADHRPGAGIASWVRGTSKDPGRAWPMSSRVVAGCSSTPPSPGWNGSWL